MVEVTTAELAVALIAAFEGCKLTSYQDSGDVWTIGVGHTNGVTEGMTITAEQAASFFAQDAAPLLAKVSGIPVLEAAAYVDFGYNCGFGALEKVLAGADTVANPVHATDRHGNVLPGLLNRRRVEELLIQLSQQLSVS